MYVCVCMWMGLLSRPVWGLWSAYVVILRDCFMIWAGVGY